MGLNAGQVITAAHLSWDTGSTALTDDVPTVANTEQQWGTETIQFDDPGVKVMVRAWVSGRLRNFADADSSGFARVMISIDGGVTYTGGFAYSVNVGTSGSDRMSYASMGSVTGTPTGDIVIKANMSASTTNVFFEAGGILADVFPR